MEELLEMIPASYPLSMMVSFKTSLGFAFTDGSITPNDW
jgi:hypothetical protein